ncbi:MAG: hypothetical protein ACR2N5_03360 [Solirubrobacterales bacterium]
MEILLALALLALVAFFVSRPLLTGSDEEIAADVEDPRIAELEARKEAKYREIRDAELDRAAGKLSEEDFKRQDAELRAEAIEILRELDRAEEVAGGGGAAKSAGRKSGAPSGREAEPGS